MEPIVVIGLGLSREDVPERDAALIRTAPVLAGGRRLLDLFPEAPGERIILAGPVADWLASIEAAAGSEPVTVLASGDPNFYGIAARLVDHFGRQAVEIRPNVSAVAAAFARLKTTWADAQVISLHGRPLESLLPRLAASDRVALFTDPHNTPAAIAALLLDRGQTNWRLAVAENMGSTEERLVETDLKSAVGMEFAPLNLTVLLRTGPASSLHLGTDDDDFSHQAGLITKAEIRAVSLARLALKPGLTIWDLGAGCGSVGLEAGLLSPGGRVWAVEKEVERLADIRANRAAFQAGWLEVIQADLPAGLDDLPDPDRVFIGGGGPALADIIVTAAQRLAPKGVMVVSAVRLSAMETARRQMARAGLDVDLTSVRIERGRALAGDIYMKPLTGVWLIRGAKSNDSGGGR